MPKPLAPSRPRLSPKRIHPQSAEAIQNDPRSKALADRYLNIAPGVRGKWEQHLSDWWQCNACPLCQRRRNVVLFRGSLPCDLLFVGEAPGDSEDTYGYPFIGPAGDLLDTLIQEAMFQAGIWSQEQVAYWNKHAPENLQAVSTNLRIGISNIVACQPTSPDPEGYGSPTIRPPEKVEAEACAPRLGELLTIAKPNLIVTLGEVAKRHIRHVLPVPAPPGSPKVVHLMHPAAILRIEHPISMRNAEKRFYINLAANLPKAIR